MSTCNSKNFSGSYTPGPPLTRKGRGRKEVKRQGEGEGKEEGKKRERQGEGEGKKGEGMKREAMIGPPQTRFLDPPLVNMSHVETLDTK
jgi:hypothetical protein